MVLRARFQQSLTSFFSSDQTLPLDMALRALLQHLTDRLCFITSGGTCLWRRQDGSAIYPSRPTGREHKPLHHPDTATARSIIVIKGCKGTPALDQGPCWNWSSHRGAAWPWQAYRIAYYLSPSFEWVFLVGWSLFTHFCLCPTSVQK